MLTLILLVALKEDFIWVQMLVTCALYSIPV